MACRLEDPDYGKVTIQTLLEIANVFDVALEVRFVSYSAFITNTRDVSISSMRVPEFKDDLRLSEPKINPIEVFGSFSGGPFSHVGWLYAEPEDRTSVNFVVTPPQAQGGAIVLH